MKNNISVIPVILCLFCLFFSCIEIEEYIKTDDEPEKEDIDVTVIIEKGKIIDFSMTGLKTGFSIAVTNRNTYALVLSELNYKVSIDEETVEEKKEQDTLTIPAGKTKSIERTFSIDFIQLAKGAVSFIDKKSLPYAVTCQCTFTGKKQAAKKTADISGTLPVPQLPAIALADAAIDTVDICGFTYNVKVEVGNPNPFWLEIKGFDYDLLVNNNSLLKIENRSVQKINAESISYIDIPLVVTFMDVAKAVPDLFSLEKLDFGIKGKVVYDSFMGSEESPFHVDDAITLPKLPRVTIEGIEPVIGIPPKLSLTLETFNPNAYDITMTLFDFTIYLGDSQIIKSRKQNVLLQSNKTNRTKLTAEINAALLNSITGKSQVTYAVKGIFEFTSVIGSLTIPLDISGTSGISQ